MWEEMRQKGEEREKIVVWDLLSLHLALLHHGGTDSVDATVCSVYRNN